MPVQGVRHLALLGIGVLALSTARADEARIKIDLRTWFPLPCGILARDAIPSAVYVNSLAVGNNFRADIPSGTTVRWVEKRAGKPEVKGTARLPATLKTGNTLDQFVTLGEADSAISTCHAEATIPTEHVDLKVERVTPTTSSPTAAKATIVVRNTSKFLAVETVVIRLEVVRCKSTIQTVEKSVGVSAAEAFGRDGSAQLELAFNALTATDYIRVTVDPDHKLSDADRKNNVWSNATCKCCLAPDASPRVP